MSMKTQIRKNGNTVVVQLEGFLNFETNDWFKKQLQLLIKEHQSSAFVFDLEHLSFVGSSGISHFVQILQEFNMKTQQRPIYANVKSEFKKLISAFDPSSSFDFSDHFHGSYPKIDH